MLFTVISQFVQLLPIQLPQATVHVSPFFLHVHQVSHPVVQLHLITFKISSGVAFFVGQNRHVLFTFTTPPPFCCLHSWNTSPFHNLQVYPKYWYCAAACVCDSVWSSTNIDEVVTFLLKWRHFVCKVPLVSGLLGALYKLVNNNNNNNNNNNSNNNNNNDNNNLNDKEFHQLSRYKLEELPFLQQQ